MSTKQRGSAWSIALAFNLYKVFGYKFIYYIMYPVTFFYFLFANNVKKSLRNYYKNINQEFTLAVYFEHLRIFAICMVDRFITKVDAKSYTFQYEHIEIPTKLLNEGTILLCSHFGGWAASSSSSHVKNRVNVVMQEVLLEGIKKIEQNIDTQQNVNIIDLNKGMLAVSVEIANALMKSEIVAIMGDRASNKKAEISVNFFGKKASFNKNPFQIAYKMKKPILVYFIILTGIQKYKVEYITIHLDQEKEQEEAVLEAVYEYVKKFEIIIKEYPNQWFNFYEFWENR